ncbi:MAG: class I SAM-dependent methyltransferase [Actinomycetota bacterium]
MTTPKERSAQQSTRFDDRYYQRFYGEGATHDPERIGHIATAVHGMASWWEVRIETVLDVGAGMGMWRDWYVEHHPAVQVRSIDISRHACATWGHERRDISTWKPKRPFDLVVCHSVLQYLDDDRAASAIDHLGAATRCVLYLELPTRSDFRHMVDRERTDLDVHHRTGTWYRRLLGEQFQQAGAGLWVRRGAVPLFELEAAGR